MNPCNSELLFLEMESCSGSIQKKSGLYWTGLRKVKLLFFTIFHDLCDTNPSWWFQPIWKLLVELRWKLKIFETTTWKQYNLLFNEHASTPSSAAGGASAMAIAPSSINANGPPMATIFTTKWTGKYASMTQGPVTYAIDWWFRNPARKPVDMVNSSPVSIGFHTSQVVGNGISEASTVWEWMCVCVWVCVWG